MIVFYNGKKIRLMPLKHHINRDKLWDRLINIILKINVDKEPKISFLRRAHGVGKQSKLQREHQLGYAYKQSSPSSAASNPAASSPASGNLFNTDN